MKNKKPSPTRVDTTRQNDWGRQSERDLEVARICFKDGFYEWSCFCAQQSAEKALKALLCKLGIVEKHITGHDLVYVVRFVLIGLISNSKEIEDHCTYLNGFDTEARYPDQYPIGDFPGKDIKGNAAEEAIASADYIRSECDEISQYLDNAPAR